MRTNRHSQRAIDMPALILIGAPALLRVLGAWIDAGGDGPAFWPQALLIAGATAIVSAGMRWISRRQIHHHQELRTAARCAQHLAYLITFLGLVLLAGLLWLDIRQVAVVGATSLARTAITLVGVWVLLAGVALQAMHLPPTQDWNLHRLGAPELNLILQLSVAASVLLPVTPPTGTTAWLAPVLVMGVALFAGQIALHALRRPGVAVMVFAAVLFYRALANYVLAQTPDVAPVGAAVQFLALAPAGALDAAYAVRLPDADARRILSFSLAAGVGVALTAALIFWPQLPGVPPLTPELVLLLIGLGAPVGFAGGWCGAIFGSAARTTHRK